VGWSSPVVKSWGRSEKGGIIDGLRYGAHSYLEDPPEKEGNVTKFANGGVQDALRL
jgi:hypothetical protein